MVGDATEDGFAAAPQGRFGLGHAGFEPCRGAAERGGADEPRVFAARRCPALRRATRARRAAGLPAVRTAPRRFRMSRSTTQEAAASSIRRARRRVQRGPRRNAAGHAVAGADGELYLAVAVEPQSVLRVNATATPGRPIAAARRGRGRVERRLWADARALDGAADASAARRDARDPRGPPTAGRGLSSAAVAARPPPADARRAGARPGARRRVYLAVARGHVETGAYGSRTLRARSRLRRRSRCSPSERYPRAVSLTRCVAA